ncbi:M15 family metallopeptidase [Amycolatopsis sp. NPDC051128]|uniref:M15 family metallopeptidase n=1 Tax=Amycolatopsis sp. NPDC051128 TaxID=3155412 RepID=UPI003431FA44
MPTSQNGYSAPITPVSRELPGGKVALRAGPTGDLLAWVGRQFHALVEPLIWPGCWGYAYRDIRGATQLSNHSSGTALDLNAPAHPLDTNPAANFRPAQIATIRAIVARTEGCVRWGGDYVGRRDPMHFEINANEQRCAAVLAKLTGSTAGGGGTPAPGNTPSSTTEVTMLDRITVTPPNDRQNTVRVSLSGTDQAAIVVRPRLGGKDGKTPAPLWIAPLYAWGHDNVGVGHDPAQTAGYDARCKGHRRFALPNALWADVCYSAKPEDPFVLETY